MKSEKNTGLTVAPLRHNNPPGGSLLGHIWASIAVTIILGIICCAVYPFVIWGIGHVFFRWQANGSLLDKDGKPTNGGPNDAPAVGSALIGQNFTLPGYFHPRFSAADNTMTGGSVAGGYDASDSGGTNLGPLSDKLLNGSTNAATTQPTTQPETIAFDGIRLRTIHYAVDNNIPFKLYNYAYVKHDDGSITMQQQAEVPLKQFQNADGSLNDTALVDAFPHPTLGNDAPAYNRVVVQAVITGTLIPGDAVTGSGSGLDPHISPDNANIQAARVAGVRNVSEDVVKALITQYTDGPSLGFLGDPGVNVLRLNLALDAKYPVPPPPATQPATQPSTQPAK
jgi:potassium-transporting ATPase KdpC subunit